MKRFGKRHAPSRTDCGLKGIRTIPYGTHMCHFYGGERDLMDAVVPFVLAGLRAGERCIWVTSAPLAPATATRELRDAGLAVEDALERGSLVIRSHDDWYRKGDTLRADEVCRLWLDEEQRALDAGYAGLRVTGNVRFLTDETWPEFMDYERAADRAFRGRRIVTLCSYAKDACGIERPDESWQIVTPQVS
jgi:hypothetical protein